MLDSDLEYSTERQKQLELGKSSAYESCKEKIDGISTSVEKRVTVAMGDVVSQLPALFDTCGAEFRPEQVETFKGALFEHMDQCLEREIGRISTNLLAPLYLECQMEVQGRGGGSGGRGVERWREVQCRGGGSGGRGVERWREVQCRGGGEGVWRDGGRSRGGEGVWRERCGEMEGGPG